MKNAPTETTFVVEEVGILQQDKVALVGIAQGQPLKLGMRAVLRADSGQLTVDLVSIGIVAPPPTNPNKRLLQVRVFGGDAKSLKSQTLHFK